MWAQIYECPKCGETWQTETVESIDTERDSVEHFLVCKICGSDVWKEKKDGDSPVVHMLTETELEALRRPSCDERDEWDEWGDDEY